MLGAPRKCKRFKSIKVQWQTAEFQTRIKLFKGIGAIYTFFNNFNSCDDLKEHGYDVKFSDFFGK